MRQESSDGEPPRVTEFKADVDSPTPRWLVTIVDGRGDAHEVRLAIDSPPGEPGPRVVEALIVKQDGLCSRDIRLPLERYQAAVGEFFTGILGGDPETSAAVSRALGPTPLGLRKLASTGRRRRAQTDDFLRAVADAYMAGGNSIEGISPDRDAQFNASNSQKFRWVKAARERGFLPPRGD